MSLVSEGAELAVRVRDDPAPREPSIAGVGDYMALMKPRVMSLVVFTALGGLMSASAHVHPGVGFTALWGIAVGAGAAGVLNMWYDADIDAVMTRTSSRPIPQGRIAPGEALGFGVTLAAFSVGVLGLLVSWLAAALLAFTLFFYVVVYTIWLKRWTPLNIVIGGAAGAFPRSSAGRRRRQHRHRALPAVPHHLLLDPPHFWALSLVRAGDYARTGANVAGRRRRRGNATADPALFRRAGADRRRAVAAGLCRHDLWDCCAAGRRPDDRVRLARAKRARR
jgi:protoheme IX farnesyltransferase